MLLCLPIAHILMPPMIFLGAAIASLGYFIGVSVAAAYTCDAFLKPWTDIRKGAKWLWEGHEKAVKEVRPLQVRKSLWLLQVFMYAANRQV